jgi:DNA-binding PadR family transcriptional regulator
MTNDKLGFFEQRVLAAVAALGEDAYGLAIYHKLSDVEKDPNQGSMYVTLDRLERKGYVVSRFILPLAERGGQPRKYYRVKREGALALRESIEMSKKTIKIVPKTFWKTIKQPIKFQKRFM